MAFTPTNRWVLVVIESEQSRSIRVRIRIRRLGLGLRAQVLWPQCRISQSRRLPRKRPPPPSPLLPRRRGEDSDRPRAKSELSIEDFLFFIVQRSQDCATSRMNPFYVPGQQRAERVRALFALVASRYDLMNDLQSFGLHRVWKNRLVKLA